MTRLSRRSLVGGLAGLGLVGGCGLLLGPAPQKVARIGYVAADALDSPWISGLWDRLRELGWVEGHNLSIERRQGTVPGEWSVHIAELVGLPVDVLVTTN